VTDRVETGSIAQAVESHLVALRESPGYRNYLLVRDRVLAMKDQASASAAGTGEPSEYWREELGGFDYLLDASPLVIAKLRQHTHHVTGVRAYDYRSNRERQRKRFEDKLRALRKRGGDELLVPESPALGGFGFEIEGRLFNVDTLKFYEVLVALKKAAVLDEFLGTAERRLVWEIGAGWGGFAYQFKTLCANVTYVITDLPELFLFSATYLQTLFPGAGCAFAGARPLADLLAAWAEYDFIFLPNTRLAETRLPRVDLTVNMVSFQEMTGAQVDAYARAAHEQDCAILYSLNRERSGYNRELTSVSEILGRYYWLHEVKVMPVGYQKMLDEAPSDKDYRHQVGWRRVQLA